MKELIKNNVRKLLFGLAFVTIIASLFASQQTIKVFVNDKEIAFNTYYGKPMIVNDRTIVPARIISERLGFDVGWDEAERKVTISDSERTIVLKIGENTALVNGKETPIDQREDGSIADTKAQIIDSRTYVPLRFITENMGGTADYKQDGSTMYVYISIDKQLPEQPTALRAVDLFTDASHVDKPSYEIQMPSLDHMLAAISSTGDPSTVTVEYAQWQLPFDLRPHLGSRYPVITDIGIRDAGWKGSYNDNIDVYGTAYYDKSERIAPLGIDIFYFKDGQYIGKDESTTIGQISYDLSSKTGQLVYECKDPEVPRMLKEADHIGFSGFRTDKIVIFPKMDIPQKPAYGKYQDIL